MSGKMPPMPLDHRPITHWAYRLIVTADEEGDDFYLGVHEVYYDDDGPHSWTAEPVKFGGSSVGEVVESMSKALADIRDEAPLVIDGDQLMRWPLDDGWDSPAIVRNGPGSGPADDGDEQHDVDESDNEAQDEGREPPQG